MTRARLIRWSLVAAIVAILLVLALRPASRWVDTAEVERGEVLATVEAEGRTRVRDRFLISAPIAAHTRRLTVQPGDPVTPGQVLVVLDPLPASALDPRSRLEAQARADAAESRRQAAAERLRAAELAAQQAAMEARRLQALLAKQLVAIEQAERAQTAQQQTERIQASARFELATAVHERDAARAALAVGSEAGSAAAALQLSSPITGVVLRRHIESATPVPAGAPLLEIGDPSALEVEVDTLSADAVRLRTGMPVTLLRWGDEPPLLGQVTRVEPGGFSKISALGVEEQRVWVIVQLNSPQAQWQALGDAYRVDARFLLDQRQAVLRLPITALFRDGEGWAVFRLAEGRARLTPVRIGLRGGLWAEALAGVSEGERVVVHPDRELRDGARARAR